MRLKGPIDAILDGQRKSKYMDGCVYGDSLIKVSMTLRELNALIDKADKALDGDSNDAEHDALYALRETLADMSTDPDRRGNA